MLRFTRHASPLRRLRYAGLPLFAACLMACQSPPPVAGALSATEAPRARNVIVMINDGAGWGAWDAAAYWQYGSRNGTPYAGFPVQLAMRTTPLNTSRTPSHSDTAEVDYDPARAWDTSASGDDALPFAGYAYSGRQATDSAAAGTALASGVKTYNNAINHDNAGRPLAPVTFLAKSMGKATGVVTSVPFAHATPAAFAAQAASRNDYHAIAHQMLTGGQLDLAMGTGAPGYNVNGTACGMLAAGESDVGCKVPDEFLSAADWTALQASELRPLGDTQPWQVLRTRDAFEALADGTRTVNGPLLGVPQVARTLQQAREGAVTGADRLQPSGDALTTSVPSLATMTRGALRHLATRSDAGFFLMVEGGATDWAAHTSKCGTQWSYGTCTRDPEHGRLIEETVDFNDAVAAVIAWVETHSSWQNTLLIITTDHDNSMPMGPDAQRIAFQPIVNHGKGRMPGMSFRPTGDHSRALVPLWAKGAGAALFESGVLGRDAGWSRHVGIGDGRYVDNTEVANVVRAALLGQAVTRCARPTTCAGAGAAE